MGKIKQDIKNLSKEAGGKIKARKAAEKWFSDASKSEIIQLLNSVDHLKQV